MRKHFVYKILCAGYLSISGAQCGDDDFDTYTRETSQSNVVQEINNDIKDCSQDMKQGWVEGYGKGGVYGAIYGGASAGIDCETQQLKSFVNQNSKN